MHDFFDRGGGGGVTIPLPDAASGRRCGLEICADQRDGRHR